VRQQASFAHQAEEGSEVGEASDALAVQEFLDEDDQLQPVGLDPGSLGLVNGLLPRCLFPDGRARVQLRAKGL
jgi:hypothetical protein